MRVRVRIVDDSVAENPYFFHYEKRGKIWRKFEQSAENGGAESLVIYLSLNQMFGKVDHIELKINIGS